MGDSQAKPSWDIAGTQWAHGGTPMFSYSISHGRGMRGRAPRQRFKEASEIPELSLGISLYQLFRGGSVNYSWRSLSSHSLSSQLSAPADEGQSGPATPSARLASPSFARAEERQQPPAPRAVDPPRRSAQARELEVPPGAPGKDGGPRLKRVSK